MLPIDEMIRKHDISFLCYADNTKLDLSFKPNKTNRIARFQLRLNYIKKGDDLHLFLLNSQS